MGASTQRLEVVSQLWHELQRVRPDSRALIALDGFDGAGKSHLSSEIAECARSTGGRPLVRVSIDGFHHPRSVRRAGGNGPEGFYRASYRYPDFRRCVVEPLRSGAPITSAIWDVARDEPVVAAPVTVPPHAIVLVDGIFLHRPELIDVWDATVWLEVPFAVSVPRGNARFADEHDADPEAPSNHRYVQGQRLYLQEAQPSAHADWVFDNTDLTRPQLRARNGFSAPSSVARPSLLARRAPVRHWGA
ncbi:nucleoside/nucleotide kinase family protein [Gulosibacter sp. ACHW.36C]|uniref:Uridine kinase n=1 Tax=Gulosibacter sediminis TaxID=1729695 RepID=A0ABY4MWE0_9MICO|nr:uridine kinase [Gulosibacter sediminis]UQN14751.1 uridine kinase [Gulosibacter sediminis]